MVKLERSYPVSAPNVRSSLERAMTIRTSLRILSAVVFVLALGFASPRGAGAQEFNCSVTLDYRSLSGSDFTFLEDLKDRVQEYINQNTWTDDRFLETERIDCTIQVVIEEATSLTRFRARLILASRRPIYNTTQYSTVVQFNDSNWQFNYAQGQPLVFDLETYDPLTSVLDFYAYVMLGYDYDTFEERGGTKHFEMARRIAERAQSQSAPGWSQIGDDRGRMNLITQILDPRFRVLRTAYFEYHYGGLDHFVAKAETARASVLAVLQRLEEFFDQVNRQYAIDLFFSAKSSELASVFQGSPQSSAAYDLLTELDPAHTSDYQVLVR